MSGKRHYDHTLLLVTMFLFLIGLIMVYSSSWPVSNYKENDPNLYFTKQLIYGIVGIVIMSIIMMLNFKVFDKFALAIYIITFVLCLLTFTRFGKSVNNATRWLNIGIQFMPSDLLKFGAICLTASYLSKKQEKIRTILFGFIPMILIAGVSGGIIYMQPDLSTSVVLVGVVIMLFLSAGINLKHFVVAVGGVVAFGVTAILFSNSAYSRLSRITAFLSPLEHKDDEGWQLFQSLLAVSSGSLFGVGIGKSSQKYFYLSQAHSDFIFAILCEELGFVGAAFTIGLFIVLISRGIRIGLQCEDLFGRYLALGISFLIGIQAFLNIAVVIGLFPPTGITLPVISQGGTSLVIFLALIGILQNIHDYNYRIKEKRA